MSRIFDFFCVGIGTVYTAFMGVVALVILYQQEEKTWDRIYFLVQVSIFAWIGFYLCLANIRRMVVKKTGL